MYARRSTGNVSSVETTETHPDVKIRNPPSGDDLCRFEHLPSYLQTNPYLRTGYRVCLSKGECLRSVFRWTNETINIWSHLGGFLFFLGLLLYDLLVTIPRYGPSPGDVLVMMFLVVSCAICMACSTFYHTFCCQSENACRTYLRWDIAGIILAFAAIFVSGIHYAFACFPYWRAVYQTLVALLTCLVLTSHLRSREDSPRVETQRVVVFTLWALFGTVPSLHWAYLEGGLVSPVICSLLPRVGVMYLIVGAAFLIYVTRCPERLCPGRVDYLGASHQLWHLLVVAALFWWHQTGLRYAEFKKSNGCAHLIQGEGA